MRIILTIYCAITLAIVPVSEVIFRICGGSSCEPHNSFDFLDFFLASVFFANLLFLYFAYGPIEILKGKLKRWKALQLSAYAYATFATTLALFCVFVKGSPIDMMATLFALFCLKAAFVFLTGDQLKQTDNNSGKS